MTDGNGTATNQATLVITIWSEAEHPEPCRARLTSRSGDASRPTISYAVSREAVLAGISKWLADLPEI